MYHSLSNNKNKIYKNAYLLPGFKYNFELLPIEYENPLRIKNINKEVISNSDYNKLLNIIELPNKKKQKTQKNKSKLKKNNPKSKKSK